MRHTDDRTTLRHYTAQSVADAARGMEEVPAIGRSEGTSGPQSGPHSACDSAHLDASACQNGTDSRPATERRKSLQHNEKALLARVKSEWECSTRTENFHLVSTIPPLAQKS